MNTQHAVGKLKVTTTDEISELSLHQIWLAVNKQGFFAIGEPRLWEVGVITVIRQGFPVKDGRAAAKEFIDRLAGFLTETGIPELGLTGEITLVSTDEENSDDTVIHRILVRNNQVLHSQASLRWENYTVTESG